MKILMVNKFLYPRGGAETYFLKIGEFLQAAGHQVEYFGMYDTKNTVGNSAGEYTRHMDFHAGGAGRFLYPFRIVYSLEAREKMKRVIRSFRPDLVHLNNINFQLTPSVIDAAAGEGVPIVQTVHDYQMLCPNHLLYDVNRKVPCEKCLRGSKWNCAANRCIHSSRAKSIIGSVEAVFYRARKTYAKVDLYICPSRFLEEKLLTDPIFRGKTVMLRNFIVPGAAPAGPKEGGYVLYFGRLSEEKGFELFLDCCRRLPDTKFTVAGTGPLSSLCEGIPNVKYVGFQTGKALDELIAGALFSVYPSVWYENCPLSVLESESLGTPVLASRMGGIPELIEDGETGMLTDGLTGEELARNIGRLLDDRTLLRRMSERCLEKRKTMITLADYCDRLTELYRFAAEGKIG